MGAPKGNKYAVGNNGGRPSIYDSPEDLIDVIEEYFKTTDKATITGLTLYIGFDSRSTLYEYAKKKEFSHIIKRAMTLVENGYEESLSSNSPAGAIFALKNMGWKDKTETELSGEVAIKQITGMVVK